DVLRDALLRHRRRTIARGPEHELAVEQTEEILGDRRAVLARRDANLDQRIAQALDVQRQTVFEHGLAQLGKARAFRDRDAIQRETVLLEHALEQTPRKLEQR